MIIEEHDYLAHYGTPRKSGRYPWGSGGTEESYNRDFLSYVAKLKSEGMSEVQVAEAVGMSTTALRKERSIAKNMEKRAAQDQAWKLKQKGVGYVEIGRIMGMHESSVRALLTQSQMDKAGQLRTTSNMLKAQVDRKGYIDVGSNVHIQAGVSDTTFKNAVALTIGDGYTHHYIRMPQLGTNKETLMKVLAGPEVLYKTVNANREKIQQITDFSDDGGRTFLGMHTPLSFSSDRLGITYGPDGGAQADGVIYVRPGVKDVSIGNSSYAQVRIKVNESHYIKGMAMYKDDLPKGKDLVFNTNKKDTGNDLDVLKPLKTTPDGKVDKDNPFGAVIQHQLVEKDASGKAIVTRGKTKLSSVMNIVNEEGDWDTWSISLASQVLSKQSVSLAKSQLDMTYERVGTEYEKISKLTNPAVRKVLLEALAEEADSSAVHLKAAAFKGQATHVILPIKSIKPGQVYAPKYQNGDVVALVRFPHGGTFEIPELVVNNNHRESKRLLGNAKDAIGIHHSVAERLSGADFDGDFVLVVPQTASKRLSVKPGLEGLQGFDPRGSYPKYEGMPKMTPKQTGMQMGNVSNLITDMTIKGASRSELTRAVKHSMVVIDAEKHELNYKQSAIDNNIKELKLKYQNGGGASTLISRAGAEERVTRLKLRKASDGGPIDRKTGKLMYDAATAESYVNSTGETITLKRNTTRLAEAIDANDLSSGTPIERVYATHSNKLKALADTVRKDVVNTPPPPRRNPSAVKVYKAEVESLDAALMLAKTNSPLERQAQVYGNAVLKAKEAAYPTMDAATHKKVKSQALEEGRRRAGAKKQNIVVSAKEWQAIQAGAISNSKLLEILDNADMDIVREHATPKAKVLMTSAKQARAAAMFNNGASRAEVASALGVSLTTLDTAVTGSEQ